MIGVDVEQSTAVFGPGEEIVCVSVQGVEEPNFPDVIGKATMVQDRSEDFVATAMGGEKDIPERKIVAGQRWLVAQRGHDIIHEVFKSVGVFELAAEGIRSVIWSLGNNQHSIATAGDELLDKLVMMECAGNVIAPTVKMDHKVDFAGLAKAFWDKNGDRVVGVMIFSRKDLVMIAMALGALGVRKWSGGQLRNN